MMKIINKNFVSILAILIIAGMGFCAAEEIKVDQSLKSDEVDVQIVSTPGQEKNPLKLENGIEFSYVYEDGEVVGIQCLFKESKKRLLRLAISLDLASECECEDSGEEDVDREIIDINVDGEDLGRDLTDINGDGE